MNTYTREQNAVYSFLPPQSSEKPTGLKEPQRVSPDRTQSGEAEILRIISKVLLMLVR